MTEFATNDLFGLLTLQANTTAEPEFHALCPPGMVALTARMTSAAPTMDPRLRDYVDRLDATVGQFANAPLGAIALAWAGMSYIVPPEEERRALDAIEEARGTPVLTAAAAILTRSTGWGAMRSPADRRNSAATGSTPFWSSGPACRRCRPSSRARPRRC